MRRPEGHKVSSDGNMTSERAKGLLKALREEVAGGAPGRHRR